MQHLPLTPHPPLLLPNTNLNYKSGSRGVNSGRITIFLGGLMRCCTLCHISAPFPTSDAHPDPAALCDLVIIPRLILLCACSGRWPLRQNWATLCSGRTSAPAGWAMISHYTGAARSLLVPSMWPTSGSTRRAICAAYYPADAKPWRKS